MDFVVTHREKLVGTFIVEANSVEDAEKEWQFRLNNGDVDFSDMEFVEGEDTFAPHWSNDEPKGLVVFNVAIDYQTPPKMFNISVLTARTDPELLDNITDHMQSFVDHVADADKMIFEDVHSVIAEVMDTVNTEWCFVEDGVVIQQCKFIGNVTI